MYVYMYVRIRIYVYVLTIYKYRNTILFLKFLKEFQKKLKF